MTRFGWLVILVGLGLGACASAPGRPPTSEELARRLGLSAQTEARLYLPGKLLIHQLDGRGASLADRQGKPLLLDFFTTFSIPSQAMMPLYEELAEHYGPHGLQVAGISLDLNDVAVTKLFTEELGVHYPIYMAEQDTKEGKTPYGFIQEIPSCLLIDGQGKLVKAYKGLVKRDVLERDIRALLP